MERKNLIERCRYYGGERTCPFNTPFEADCWEREKKHVEFIISISDDERLPIRREKHVRETFSLSERVSNYLRCKKDRSRYLDELVRKDMGLVD